MLNKILYKIFMVFDIIKDFFITWGIKILLVLFFCMILHNVVKTSEISSRYEGKYKNLVHIYEEDDYYNDKMMNMYSVGEGSKTIVILAGFGSQSPVIQYKALAEGLKDSYRVVIVEYFGYGYSMSINKPRNNENIAHEIKTALENYGISGPYVLMPHSHSNIYAMKFQQMYPENVEAIISLDGQYPAEIEDKYYEKKLKADISNIKITSIFELTGYERILSYISPSTFYINKMKEMPELFGKEELSVYRTMIREINKLEENINEMKNYQYPEYLPVLEILASDTVNSYKNVKQNNESNIDLNILANGLITNEKIQKVVEIKGDHMLQFSNPNEVVKEVKSFLGN